MSITDELRRYAANWDGWFYSDKNGGLIHAIGHDPIQSTPVPKVINAIADRIDAEYQKAIRELNNLADASVLLPVDADGGYIHIGDVMETDNGIREVDVLQKSSRKWSVGLVPVGGGAFSWHDAETLRHHHAPTVEDVLRECIANVCRSNTQLHEQGCPPLTMEDIDEELDEYINEYASKLRLAGEDA